MSDQVKYTYRMTKEQKKALELIKLESEEFSSLKDLLDYAIDQTFGTKIIELKFQSKL